MLKKSERLNSSLFTKYFKEGKRSHGPVFTVVFSPYDSFLCAVVVGKKIKKKAYERNYLRRLVYETIRKEKKDKNITGIYIFLVKSEINSFTKVNLKKAVISEVGRILNKR